MIVFTYQVLSSMEHRLMNPEGIAVLPLAASGVAYGTFHEWIGQTLTLLSPAFRLVMGPGTQPSSFFLFRKS